MSFKEAVKRYQSYIPTAVIAVCTWIFSNIGSAVIASINDFKSSYGQMKTDIKDAKIDIVALKESDGKHGTMISHAQERELSIDKKIDDNKNLEDKKIDDNKASSDIQFAQIFTTLKYVTKN